MADWDAADLLARCKRYANRPATDESMADADWYAFLTEAEAHWKPILALYVPGDMMGAPTLLTAAGDGKRFTFPSHPIGKVELYTSLTGRLMEPGAYWDAGADYVLEGDTVRITNGRERTFTDGAPYGRWITPPAAIAASTDSTILPAHLRALLVFNACARWATRSGARDPQYYEKLEQSAAFGNPSIGDPGLIGSLRASHMAGGMAGFEHEVARPWWRPV